MTNRFESSVAIVTGAGRGIGESTARRLAAEGAAVVIAELDAATGEGVAADIREQRGPSHLRRCRCRRARYP